MQEFGLFGDILRFKFCVFFLFVCCFKFSNFEFKCRNFISKTANSLCVWDFSFSINFVVFLLFKDEFFKFLLCLLFDQCHVFKILSEFLDCLCNTNSLFILCFNYFSFEFVIEFVLCVKLHLKSLDLVSEGFTDRSDRIPTLFKLFMSFFK